MNISRNRRQAPSYGTGFDDLRGLPPHGAGHRWFQANDRTAGRPLPNGQHR